MRRLQELPPDVLGLVANHLPMRDARRFGQTFSGARLAARASVARRPALHHRVERAAQTLAQRNRDIMAVVTRLVHASRTAPLRDIEPVMVRFGEVEGSTWRYMLPSQPHPHDMFKISLRIRHAGAPVRGSWTHVSFESEVPNVVEYAGGPYLDRANLRARQIAGRPIVRAARLAFERAGYRVEPSPGWQGFF